MPISKQTVRRRLAKLSAELHAFPWAIEPRVLGALDASLRAGNVDAVQAMLSFGESPDDIKTIDNGVAVIPITGVLQEDVNYAVRWGLASSYQLIERAFNQALDDDNIKAVLFYVNSPGGSAIGCKRIADLVFESRNLKPVRAYVQGMCCSAAYYIASAADRIETTADSLVGCVGAIFPHLQYADMLQEMGVGATVFVNAESPNKSHGNIYEPLTEGSRATLQRFVESYGAPFISDVARYRGIDRDVVAKEFGRGDSMRADAAGRMVDSIVANYRESIGSLIAGASVRPPVEKSQEPPESVGNSTVRRGDMNERIKAQLFALGVVGSANATDSDCTIALKAWCAANSRSLPAGDDEVLAMLRGNSPTDTPASGPAVTNTVQQAHDVEQTEARLEQLSASAALFNGAVGYEAVTDKMVLDSARAKQSVEAATKAWGDIFAKHESPVPTARVRVTGSGEERYATDVVDALVARAGNNIQLSDSAAQLVHRPLKAVALDCLHFAGHPVDPYDDPEHIAEMAMSISGATQHHRFFSANENGRYIQASGAPAARPGDFPNILSNLARKFLDTIELDDDYSFREVSAVLPGGLNDFKPAMMINKGIMEELDEVQDAEQIAELGISEEVLSYIFLRRFANKWGWTPVMIANDDLAAFVEGMLGLDEAWNVTQNRLVLDRFTANETLLDGAALFANRTDVGSAANNNDQTSGGVPSDTQWGQMEALYADIGGVATGRRVRGTLNTWFGPTGIPFQEARRTFMPLNAGGIEPKSADTTANVGIYRGQVTLVPESELRTASVLKWYGLRNPTRLNTATVVRGYFNGYGEQGRRERWYDPDRKVTWVSIEGRIAVAVKNWRYVIRNAGA